MKLFPLLIAIILLAPASVAAQSRRVKTKIKVAKEAIVPGSITVTRDDTISGHLVSKVEISGYQKPAGSDKETFSVTNNTDKTLVAIEMNLEYLTPEGEQIHKRKVKADCDVPPGETRVVDLRSWDRQRSWYYLHGQKPRKQARPYTVLITPLTLHLLP